MPVPSRFAENRPGATAVISTENGSEAFPAPDDHAGGPERHLLRQHETDCAGLDREQPRHPGNAEAVGDGHARALQNGGQGL